MKKINLFVWIALLSLISPNQAQSIFSEFFDETNTSGTSVEGINWSCSTFCHPGGTFTSNGSALVCNNPKEVVSWSTASFDISEVYEMQISIDFEVEGDLEGNCNLGASCECAAATTQTTAECGTISSFDFIDFGYRIDGGPLFVIPDQLGCSSNPITCVPACGSGPFGSCDVSANGIHTYYGDCLSGVVDDLDMNGGNGTALINLTHTVDVSSGSNLELIFTMMNGASTEFFRLLSVSVTATVLPVALTDFSARIEDRQVILDWQTASEFNNAHFEIEHSSSMNGFKTIGFVDGSDNTHTTSNYQFYHNHPSPGNNLYRLKQVDYDGQYEYSNLVKVNFKKTKQIQLYPTLSNEQVKLFLPPIESNTNISIFDLSGKRYLQTMGSPYVEEHIIDVSCLPKQHYIIRVIQEDHATSLRFITF